MFNIPPAITSGDTVEWSTSLAAYPATDFVLSWSIRGDSSLDLTAQADGDNYKTELTDTQTSALIPGEYYWQAYVTNTDSERFNVGSGHLRVTSNLADTTTPFDGRSEAQKMLDEVNFAISACLKGQSYRIKERELTRADLSELIEWRDRLKWEIRNEQSKEAIANGQPNPSRIQIRFR